MKIDRDDRMHEFIKISYDIGFLEVTPDHLMIVNEKLIQAQHLQIGQYVGQHQITNIETTKKIGKVTIFTSEGSVIANGIPTTIICA